MQTRWGRSRSGGPLRCNECPELVAIHAGGGAGRRAGNRTGDSASGGGSHRWRPPVSFEELAHHLLQDLLAWVVVYAPQAVLPVLRYAETGEGEENPARSGHCRKLPLESRPRHVVEGKPHQYALGRLTGVQDFAAGSRPRWNSAHRPLRLPDDQRRNTGEIVQQILPAKFLGGYVSFMPPGVAVQPFAREIVGQFPRGVRHIG